LIAIIVLIVGVIIIDESGTVVENIIGVCGVTVCGVVVCFVVCVTVCGVLVCVVGCVVGCGVVVCVVGSIFCGMAVYISVPNTSVPMLMLLMYMLMLMSVTEPKLAKNGQRSIHMGVVNPQLSLER
jgi:hypothetical protein